MFKYYKSDFPVHLKIGIKRQDPTGALIPVTTDIPFNLRFYVDKKGTAETGYLCSYDGTTVHNCSILSPTDIMAYIDQSQLPFPTGNLFVEVEFIDTDPHYEGDNENNLKRLYSTGIILTEDPDLDDEGEITIEVFNDVLSLEVIAAAEAKAIEASRSKAEEIVPDIARQVAQEAISSFIYATDAQIDALWQD